MAQDTDIDRLKQIAHDLTELKAQLHRSQIDTLVVHIRVLLLVEELLVKSGEKPQLLKTYRQLLSKMLDTTKVPTSSNDTSSSGETSETIASEMLRILKDRETQKNMKDPFQVALSLTSWKASTGARETQKNKK